MFGGQRFRLWFCWRILRGESVGLLEGIDDAVDEFVEVRVGGSLVTNFVDRVDDGGVMFAAKSAADFGQ